MRGHQDTDADIGETFCYENANGLIEIAVNQRHAADSLEIKVGDRVTILPG